MHHSAHILRTIFHLTRKLRLFSKLPPKERALLHACYYALQTDQERREAQQIATLQFQTSEVERYVPRMIPRIDTTDDLPLRFANVPDTHPLRSVPVFVCIYLENNGDFQAAICFSRN